MVGNRRHSAPPELPREEDDEEDQLANAMSTFPARPSFEHGRRKDDPPTPLPSFMLSQSGTEPLGTGTALGPAAVADTGAAVLPALAAQFMSVLGDLKVAAATAQERGLMLLPRSSSSAPPVHTSALLRAPRPGLSSFGSFGSEASAASAASAAPPPRSARRLSAPGATGTARGAPGASPRTGSPAGVGGQQARFGPFCPQRGMLAAPRGDHIFPHVRSMSTIMDDLHSMDSFAHSRMAEMGSQADLNGSPSKLSSFAGIGRGGGVGFDPGVEVVAFKPKWPAGELKNLGRTYECTLEGAVQVPQSWSFVSTSSIASTATSPGSPFVEPPIGMRRFPGEALSTVLEELSEPPPTRGCPSFGSSAAQPAIARGDSFGTLMASVPSPPPPPPRHQRRSGDSGSFGQAMTAPSPRVDRSNSNSFSLKNSPTPRADTFGTLLPGPQGTLPIKQLQFGMQPLPQQVSQLPQQVPQLPLPPPQPLQLQLQQQPPILPPPPQLQPPAQRLESVHSFGIFGRLP